jgi:hypothetical protein
VKNERHVTEINDLSSLFLGKCKTPPIQSHADAMDVMKSFTSAISDHLTLLCLRPHLVATHHQNSLNLFLPVSMAGDCP